MIGGRGTRAVMDGQCRSVPVCAGRSHARDHWTVLLRCRTVLLLSRTMAYCFQRAARLRVGALKTVGALAVRSSKCEVID